MFNITTGTSISKLVQLPSQHNNYNQQTSLFELQIQNDSAGDTIMLNIKISRVWTVI